MSLLEATDIAYGYRVGERMNSVLQGVSFRVEEGDFTAIQGPSGSGKSTLFYILGGLLRPLSGSLRLDGEELATLSRDGLAVMRNEKIGFVFQQFHLLPGATVLENILLPCRYPLETAQVTPADRARAESLARELGISDQLAHLPNQLSGGQQQRVAIARALMRDVKLILADEPTGALDSRSAAQTMDLLRELNSRGRTILLITHDSEIARQCKKTYLMRDGRLSTGDETASTTTNRLPAAPPRVVPANHPLRLIAAVLPSAAQNLLRNKVKSMLTMLGVIIGVAAVLAMITLGNFTKHSILESYEALGVNKIGIEGYPNWRMKAGDYVGAVFRSFDLRRDIEPLPKLFPEVVAYSPVVDVWYTPTASFGGLSVSEKLNVIGVNEKFFPISNATLSEGYPVNAFHVQNQSQVCVIGHDLSERLFRNVPPIGQFMSVSLGSDLDFSCRVIGILSRKSTNVEWKNPNWNILVPYTFIQVLFPRLFSVVLQAKSGTNIERSSKKIKAYFEKKYGKSGRFSIDSDAALLDQMRRFLTLFTLLLGSIAALALFVGGIGINNMMLVSVSERLREIGLRKALGATDRSLRYQFLTESMCLCLVAGVIGLVGGFVAYEGLIYGVAKLVPKVTFQWIFEPWAMTLSLASMVIVGISSGLVPAIKAQKLEVIEALRSE